MTDTGARGALNGVDELVTFLGSASSNDRFAFSKRANVIFECRTCFTLFRKADGFMRHVTRCDSSRGADAESEPERRSLYAPQAAPVSAMGRVSRVVPLKKPALNGMTSPKTTPVPVLQQGAVAKQPVVKPRIGRPPKAQKTEVVKLPTKNAETVIPTPTPPTVVTASGNETNSSAARAPKRPYNRKVLPTMVTVEKMQKVDEGYGGEKLVSMPSKSTKSEDPELSAEIRPSRMRKTPKWLEDSAFYV